MPSFEGDAHPVGPSGFDIEQTPDANEDGSFDFMVAGGNSVITDGVTGAPDGDGGAAVAWDAPQVWRSFSSAFAVIVGNSGNCQVALNAGNQVNVLHVALGMLTGSNGRLDVVGVGSRLCNDRDAMLGEDNKQAIALARGVSSTTITYNHLFDGNSNTANPNKHITPCPAINANLWVGRKGQGELSVEQGGQVIVRHRLLVGGYETDEDDEISGGSPVVPYEYDPDSPIVDLMKVTTAGDLANWADATGGVVRISGVGSELVVTGLTANNQSPFPPEQTTGSTAENERYNAFLDRTQKDPVKALDSLNGANGVFHFEGGRMVCANAGFTNRGLIGATGAAPSTIALMGSSVALTNEGLLVVREGAVLVVEGTLANTSRVHLEPGATLVVDSLANSGVVTRGQCGKPPILMVGGEVAEFDEGTLELAV